MEHIVERKEYLDRLIQWKDEQIIKVVTGIRRCGKSTLLLQYQAWLKANGISEEQIVSINFEELEYEELQDYRKLYIVDLGLRNHILPRSQYDLDFSLENMVYFELLRRSYRVMIGKVGNTEVDFVAEKQGAYTYFQVTADMTAKDTFNRELKPLTNIRNNYEKIVLTGDRLTVGNYNGIQVRNLSDWLLGK